MPCEIDTDQAEGDAIPGDGVIEVIIGDRDLNRGTDGQNIGAISAQGIGTVSINDGITKVVMRPDIADIEREPVILHGVVAGDNVTRAGRQPQDRLKFLGTGMERSGAFLRGAVILGNPATIDQQNPAIIQPERGDD